MAIDPSHFQNARNAIVPVEDKAWILLALVIICIVLWWFLGRSLKRVHAAARPNSVFVQEFFGAAPASNSETSSVSYCHWVADGGEKLMGWRCSRCGIRAFSSDGFPPKECKQGLEGKL